MGLIDHSLPGSGKVLETRIRNHVKAMWKRNVDVSPAGHAAARAQELGEMAKDSGARAVRYHERRRRLCPQDQDARDPLRFAGHRRLAGVLDEEESDSFDDVGG
ncbi:hypothetical protein EV126DRAFT_489759 [Verticillium dahliae]|nr:hypothetical protein EV126DRAFT_489759 [Verticillium dahliae]